MVHVASKCFWVPLHTRLKSLESQVQGLHHTLAWPAHWKAWPPHPHVVMPRSWKMRLETNFISVGLGNLGVYCKSTRNLSHFRNVCLLAWTIVFYSLWQNQAKRVAQDPCIHCHVILNLWTLLLSRWASKLAQLHGNIVMCLQMLHQVVPGYIRCIAFTNLTSKFWPIPCPMTPSMAPTFEIKNQKPKT
jgi:hypothetical protein